jgi:undecaprenyl-diphosphatase
MELFYAVFLGILQGATEFLPISSSGHLVLAEAFLGVKEASLAFDVALHLGTLLAVLVYFRKDFLLMGRALVAPKDNGPETRSLRRLAFFICLATLPAVVAALAFGDWTEHYLRQPLSVAAMLAGVGLLLLWAEKVGNHRRNFQSISLADSILIGCSQALALIPGVSRSGITMTTGLFRGLNRQSAARFSFLLSAPIILGAGLHELPEILHQGISPDQTAFFLAGFLASAVSGYLFVAFLLRFIRTNTFEIFAYYRFAVAALVILAHVYFAA